jgi:capsid assembly protease
MDAQSRRAYIIGLLTGSPFMAIRPEALMSLISAAQLCGNVIDSGLHFSGSWEAAKPSMIGSKTNRVSVIPIQGVLTSDGPAWLGSNYKTISDAAEQASADGSVKRVIMHVDSPGGAVNGLPETAAIITALAKVKPVSAIVEGDSASAAYWLTSQAHDVTLTPSGEVGSVGVRMMHMDLSKMLEDYGVKVTELQSGLYKTEWSPYKPLSEDAKADMQKRLDAVHTDFLSAVSSGRVRASAEMKEGRFGEGRMFSSAAALTHGLVDKIQTAREFFRAIVPPEEEQTFGAPRRARVEIARRQV